MIGNRLVTSQASHVASRELSARLERREWRVTAASSRTNRVLRLADMVGTTWSRRADYDVAQIDVFSGSAFAWAEAVCWTLRRLRKPYVLALRGGNLPEFARRRPGRVRALLESASVVISPSEYLRREMRAYRPDIRLIPNGIDLSDYEPAVRHAPQPRLVWLRAFHDIYNPLLAPSVLEKVRSRFPRAELTMIGPDKNDGSLERTRLLASRLSLAPAVSFVGQVPKSQVGGLLGRADIFLNTANVDNTPVTVIEALACGLCVVSTNVGGIPDLLTHERNALLVPPDDAQAMADAVARILVEPGLAARLSSEARRHAASFDWPGILDQWEASLADANAGHPSLADRVTVPGASRS